MQELRDIAVFGNLPDEEVQWLTANSYEERLERGHFFFRENEPAERFYIVLEGELQVLRTINGQERVIGTTPRGIMGGEISLLNNVPSQVTSCAIVPSRLRVFELPAFRQIFAFAPTFGTHILQIASTRTQLTTATAAQQEKMAALGKLSAGLAHELNNPAAAARRSAELLRELLPRLHERAVKICALGLNETQIDDVMALQREASRRALTAPRLGPLEQSDREDEIGSWLDDHGVEEAWDIAPLFVQSQITVDDLETLTSQISAASLSNTLSWLYETLNVASLLDEVGQSTQRISELVGAVKSYTYMDQGAVQEVDVHKGLETTLKVLSHKLRDIHVIREYDAELPTITARGGELNQVWTNLIDNAIDALKDQPAGEIRLITRYENAFVMVEVADNGPGIPSHVKPRLFEPFFTTKEVGSGTGLGLDISYRVITQHQGSIEVQSEPGLTRFIVRLPLRHPSTADSAAQETP